MPNIFLLKPPAINTLHVSTQLFRLTAFEGAGFQSRRKDGQ
jgi:hypothetical protein